MVVDLKFELSYLLTDILGREVEVTSYEFDPDTGRLCVTARVDGNERRGCIVIKPCKGLREESKQVRCISKTLSANEKLARELASSLGG